MADLSIIMYILTEGKDNNFSNATELVEGLSNVQRKKLEEVGKEFYRFVKELNRDVDETAPPF